MFEDRIRLAYSLKKMDSDIEDLPEINPPSFNGKRLEEYFEYYDIVSLKPDVINIAYVGSLFGKRATPSILSGFTQALDKLNKDNQQIHLHFVGPLAPVFQARFQGRSDTTLHGPQDHKRALAFESQCDLNILLATTQVQDSYPGKLFNFWSCPKTKPYNF